MSDDFDDLPDDDLFTNPASLAAIEQAVVSAEQNARTQGNVQSTGRRPQQQQVNGALGLGGGMGIRKPDGKYHHSVTLAGSSNLRGRGSARPPSTTLSHQNASKSVSNVQSMGMQPRPAGAPTFNGRVASPGPPPPPPKQPVFAHAPPVEEEEEEYGPEISVDDFGNYFNSEVKDVRRDGLDESILQAGNKEKQELGTVNAKAFGTRVDAAAASRLGERKLLTRSTSVGTGSGMISSSAAQNRPNPEIHNAPHVSTANRSALGTGTRSNLGSSQLYLPGSAGKTFKRVNSDGENARRQAIQSVLSGSASQASRPSSSFQGAVPYAPGGVGVPKAGGDVRQVGRFREMSDHASTAAGVGSVVQGNGVREAEERPSISAGIGNQEVEDLKRQLAQLLKENKEKEEKTSKAMQDLWRYQGEAKNVRLKADEEKKHAEGKYTDLQKQLADLQEMLRLERVGHKRALDTVQTDHAFKMHNEQSSHIKPRIATSQRNRNAVQQMQSTPSRPHRGAVAGSQQALSHLQAEVTSYDHTPSRSPTKKGGNTTSKKRLGSMGPPNVPDVAASFMTPARPLTASSKKARVLQEVKNKVLTTGSDFRGLHDAFADSQMDPKKKRKTNGEMGEPIAGSPTPSMFDQGEQDPPAWNGYEEVAPPLADESGQEDYEDVDDGDIITEVCHIIFTHFHTPLWETAEGPVKTVQRILTGQPDPNHVSYPLYQERCSLFLEACGNQEALPTDFCRDINESLWDLLGAMLVDNQEVDPATVVSVMQLLTMLRVGIPQFASFYSAAASDMPRNSFEILISQFWQQTEPSTSVVKHSTSTGEDVEPEERLSLSWAYQAELGHAICSLISGIQTVDGEAAPCYASFASSPAGIRALISPKSPIAVVFEALETLNLMSSKPEIFRALLSVKSNNRNSQEVVDPKRPPLLDSLCGILKHGHPEADALPLAALCLHVLAIVANLCQVHEDGRTLLGNSFHLVPSLVQLAGTLANQIWGICAEDDQVELNFGVLVATVTVLHMLIFPSDLESQNAPNVHLRSVIATALDSPKEYNGLHHIFITAFGRISYAPVPDMQNWSRVQVTTLRYLAQDLLSELVGGNQREDDAIYAMYVLTRDEEMDVDDQRNDVGRINAEEEDEGDGMVIVIEDSSL